MTKKQFINQLNYHLSVLTIEERKEIISFYEDRFANAIFEGKTEEDVINELETPEEIAKNVLMEYGIQKRVKEQRVEPAAIVGLVFFDLFITSWLLPVLLTVSGSITLSWFSYFTTFRVFFDYGFGTALATFIMTTGLFALYLIFIIYFVGFSIKLALLIVSWHIKVFSGNRNVEATDRLDNFSTFDQLAKIKITHKVLGLVAVASLVVVVATFSIWRATSDTRVEQVEGVLEVHEFEVSDLDNYTLSTSLSNIAVDVEYGTSDKIIIRHQNNDDAEIEYNELTNGLEIVDKTRAQFWNSVSGYDFFISFMNNDWTFSPSHMTIEVPVGINFAELEVHTDNGTIDIEGMEATILDVMTVNGELSLMDVEADSIKAVTTNGVISFNDVFAETVFIESVNGEIELTDVNTAQNDGSELIITLVNGEINIEDAYFLIAEIDNVNGDITYLNSDHTYQADRIELTTVNGSESHNINH